MVLLMGCGETAVSVAPLPTLAATLTQPLATAFAPPTPIPPASNTPIGPTATAVSASSLQAVPPTNTPLPPLSLAVPAGWETRIGEIVANAVTSHTWEVIAVSEVAAAQLIENGAGQLVWQEPIVLAVPFTTEWEFITQVDAEAILANGHELVAALPWSELTPDLKPLRVDGRFPVDPDYPFHNRLTLQSETGTSVSSVQAVAELLPILQTALAPEPIVHLASVGDIMLDRGLGIVIQQGNLTYPFANVVTLLQGADITVGNVESALGDVGQPELKSYPFRAPPTAAQALALAGFDVVSLANNHGMDYGPEALLQAVGLLEAQGIAPIGAGANFGEAHTPHLTQINGLSLAFLGYVNVPVEVAGFDTAVWTANQNSPGLAWGSPEVITADVTAVSDSADLVIVVLHSGYEYVEEPSEAQATAARAAIDAGADLVIGHHAHILQGIEFYNDGVIVYGLGNFAFEIDGPPETAVLNIWLDQDGVHSLELIPAFIQEGGQPRLAETWEAAPILRRVYFLTRILNGR